MTAKGQKGPLSDGAWSAECTMRLFAWCLIVSGLVLGSIFASYAIHETTMHEALSRGPERSARGTNLCSLRCLSTSGPRTVSADNDAGARDSDRETSGKDRDLDGGRGKRDGRVRPGTSRGAPAT
jgi:hypothetical protein